MNTTEGILLGLSTGAVCVAYCGPVLIPFLLAERGKINKNILFVVLFLSGRLVAYIFTGFIVGLLGTSFLTQADLKIKTMGIIYIVLASLLITYGFYRFREICLGRVHKRINSAIGKKFPFIIPLAGGAITGLNLCPPFMLAIARAASSGDLSGSIWFFLMFFLGTSVYFLPMPFIGVLHRARVLQIIGKFAAILAGFIYLYLGIVMTLK
ncbi:MAG: sulfite exporter TauE/SafE family protein [Bacteroidales bacterium]